MIRYSESAERAILGAAVAGSGVTSRVLSILPDHAFYAQRHQDLWGAIRRIHDSGVHADIVSIRDLLEREKGLQKVGGDAYLMELSEEFISPVGIEDYAKIVNEHFVARSAIAAARHLAQAAEDGASATELVLESVQTSSRLTEAASPKGTASGNMMSVTGNILTNEKPKRILTGFRFWDDCFGFRPSNQVILAAGTGVGKSSLALGIAVRAKVFEKGETRKANVLYVAQEMNLEEMTEKLMAMKTGIKHDRIVNRMLSPDEMEQCRNAVLGSCQHLRIKSLPTVALVGAEARAMANNGGLDLIVIDTLQLMGGAESDPVERVSNNSTELKRLAMDPAIGAATLVLSQFGREVMKSGRRPTMYDGKGSSSIEQDANTYIIMHQDLEEDPNDITLYFDKVRGGATTKSVAAFDKSISRFYDIKA